TVRPVREVMRRTTPRVVRMRAGEIAVVGASPEHPFWDAAAAAFRPVAALSLESRVLALLPGAREPRELPVEEVAVVPAAGPVEVWNLEVEGEHTYFVEGILVHNKSTSGVGGGDPASGGGGAGGTSVVIPTGAGGDGGEGGGGQGGGGGGQGGAGGGQG